MRKKVVKKCRVCGKQVWTEKSNYCLQCRKFSYRMRTKHFQHRAVKAIWQYIRKNGYVCYYTKMPLDLSDTKSPWYAVFDHWIPGDPRKVVLTTALFNEMKSDLSEKEFWNFITKLVNYKKKRSKIRMKKPIYWYRLHP